jgi:hypothetical protein
MLPKHFYEKYKQLKQEFENESMVIAEKLAKLSGYELNDNNNEPLWENCRPYFHSEDMTREEIIVGHIYYNYQSPSVKEMLKQKDEDLDFYISCTFPARYLWQNNWTKSFVKDMEDGLLHFSISGDTSKLIINKRIPLTEMTDKELRETFDNFSIKGDSITDMG